MESELPDVLDLLRVAIAARAWRRGGRCTRSGAATPACSPRTQARGRRAPTSGSPPTQALDDLKARAPLTGSRVRRGAQAGRAPRRPASATLAAQAPQARSERAAQRSEQAAKAAPKIQLVVALLLVPAVLLLVAAAMLPALTTR